MPNDEYQISPRLKDALISYLVADDLSEEGDYWLRHRLRGPTEWTEHLGEQLRIKDRHGVAGIHDTLLAMIPEIDRLVGNWPPPTTPEQCESLALVAVKNLDSMEVYATLLAGPGEWRRGRISAETTVEGLSARLKPMLHKALASELSRVFDNWVKWKVPALHVRRKEAIEAENTRQLAEAEASRPKVVRKRDPQAIAARRADSGGPPFNPPPRTT
jgi:hypothetical protein